MLKILTIIGARPQIIKAAALSRAIKNHFADKIREVILHTGQHYDTNMSQVFFDELHVPSPNYNLNIGSGSHGTQTASMMTGIEEVIQKEKPGAVVVYGDTNSTLAGALAAAKLHVPLVHIEAGLRSFNKTMPEEINRILCDHVSTLLFSPTKTGYDNLIKEGFKEKNVAPYSINRPGIYHCGDIMYDNSLYFSEVAEKKTDILKKHNLQANRFILATIHRDNNTDNPERLNNLFSAMNTISVENTLTFFIPLHPRTSKLLEKNLLPETYTAIQKNSLIQLAAPVSFLEMIALEKNAMLVMTDSGGVQKEAFFFKKPCIIFRSETEWVELEQCGAARLADADKNKILEAFRYFSSANQGNGNNLSFPPVFGDGKAAEFICREMLTQLKH